MLKIEDLKAGDELVCIDRDGFLNERRNAEYLLHNKMIVTDVSKYEAYLLCENDEKSCRNYIYSHELKYFKKKEQYTFDNLIDVAVQAYKDNCTSRVVLEERGVCIHANGNAYGFYRDSKSIADGINFIQSLYKETFVIECEEDIEKTRENAKVTLANGNKCIVTTTYSGGYVRCIGLLFEATPVTLNLVALKGATVEQSK